MPQSQITDELLDKYTETTRRALAKIKFAKKITAEHKKYAEDFLDMAQRYFKDAQYFRDKGDLPRAFGALNYAHAWLDAGARVGWFDVDGDNHLFTVDAKG